MTSSSPTIPFTMPSTGSNIANNAIQDIDMENDHFPDPNTSSSSSSSSSQTSSSSPQFPRFNDLPAELRHQIWRLAIPPPGQGINFFNVHAFPNDHQGCNRSTSPPWVYLDLRRLDIGDDDDDVSAYDPSAFQARADVRASCREARIICAIPESKRAVITLTRPQDGLFVHAGDGQLRSLTPFHLSSSSEGTNNTNANNNNNNNTNDAFLPQTQTQPEPPPTVPVVQRKISVHADDVLCISIENCSFNLAHEENWFFERGYDVPNSPDEFQDGWAFDPQLTPPLPLSIRTRRICVGMARCNGKVIRAMAHTLYDLVHSHVPDELRPIDINLSGGPGEGGGYLMHFPLYCDNVHGYPDYADLTTDPPAVWDRFGDRYLRLAWGVSRDPYARPKAYRFVKMVPDKTDLRERYIRSAVLHSPKRPARS